MKGLIILSRREAYRMQVLKQIIRKRLSLKGGARLMKGCYHPRSVCWPDIEEKVQKG